MYDSILFALDTVCSLEIESGENQEASNAKAFFIDERGRFRVWAKNVGAHRHEKDKASLEHRLQEAPHIRSALLVLLQNLESLITEGLLYRLELEVYPVI